MPWPEIELGDVCEFKYGKSLAARDRDGGKFAVYGSNGVVGGHSTAITSGPTIIVGRKGSFGEVAYSECACWPIDTTYYVDSTSTKADLKWLAYRLEDLGLNKLNRAAAIPGLNRADAYRQRLLLPPVDEQRRIAAILDKADALRAKRREAIAKLDQLLQSVFLEMFSGSDRGPMVAIGDICEVKGGKRLPKGEDYSDSVTPFRYVRVSDVEMGHVHEENLRYLRPDVQQKIKRYTVSEGDLIISIAGTIGLVAPVETTLDGANLTENAAKIVPKDAGAYVSNYLSFALSMPDAQSQIRSQTGQVTIGKLALFRIEKVKVPLPPVEAQVRFSEIVRRTREQAHTLRLSASQLDSVFASLQHRAFSGTL
ncbi:restriction endonuclease subunit S [Luteimonas sp. WGS1318]|uniref:restriction endonuclease subunit S n=1 Tax=Luteimonas sp. WGS1318 TaxID=3366815 RepID=UPI00372D1828